MAIGDIKTFDIVYTGLTLQINAIDMGGGTVRFEVTCLNGYADINALYWNDGIADGSSFDLGTKKDNSLNMNGTGEDWDGGIKLSSAGIGAAGVDKPTYLQTGESYVTDATLNWSTLDTLGVRATSTSTAGGSIKGVDGDAEVTECPHASINDVTVAEEAGIAVFTVSLAEAYLYDVEFSYTTSAGTAGSSDYTTTTGTVTILAGATSATISVPILDDTNPEPTETFVVNLTGATADIPDLAGGPDSFISVEHCIVDAQGVGTITDTDQPDDGNPPADLVTAVDDNPACGVEKLVPIVGNVLANDTDSLSHDLDITHVNGLLLSDLDPTPDGTVYDFAITGGTLKIDAETGAFEFKYTGAEMPVGAPDWTGSFTYTVTDGDSTNDSADSDHTATVNLCIDAPGGSPGYWAGNGANPHSLADSEQLPQGLLNGTTTFDDFFGLDNSGERTWGVNPNGPDLYDLVQNDITLQEALTTSYLSEPDVGNEAALARQAAASVANFYDEDSQDAFMTAYVYQRNLNDNDTIANDFYDGNGDIDASKVLLDLQTVVHDAYEGTVGAYSVGVLTALLEATHE